LQFRKNKVTPSNDEGLSAEMLKVVAIPQFHRILTPSVCPASWPAIFSSRRRKICRRQNADIEGFKGRKRPLKGLEKSGF
jgi:hypothetical protein